MCPCCEDELRWEEGLEDESPFDTREYHPGRRR
jgi:hypothetical protein